LCDGGGLSSPLASEQFNREWKVSSCTHLL
jgi:hypothetical protein